MGLIKCPDCGNMVSDRAAFCPSCGCPGDVIREEYDKENDPQRLTYIYLMFNLLKCADRKDLVLANDCFMNELKKRFDVGYPVTFIGRDNFDEHLKKITDKQFEFPYVLISSSFRYVLDYRKFTVTRSDRTSYQLYYDPETLPSDYAPNIEVFSDKPEQVEEIVAKITELLGTTMSYWSPYLAVKDGFLSFSDKIEKTEGPLVLVDINDTKLIYGSITLKLSPWASYINDEVNPVKYDSLRTLRNVQLAQFCLHYFLMKDDCDKEIGLYNCLFKSEVDSDYQNPSNEYKSLKYKVVSGDPIHSELVDKAFPNISLIYHDLPNDICDRIPAGEVKRKVDEVIAQYENTWKRICDGLNLPEEINVPDWNYSGYSNNMRSIQGLGFIIEALTANHVRSIEDIVNEYTEMLAVLGEEGRIRSDEQYEEFMEMFESGRRRRREFTRGVIRTAAGVALGNKISDMLRNKD